MTWLLLSILCLFLSFWAGDSLKADIMKARLEICSGCPSDMYPEIRDFVKEDILLFHNIELAEVADKDPPELYLVDNNGEDRESFRIDLLFREEIFDLLVALGFYTKDTRDEVVPEDYATGPYLRNQDEVSEFYELLDELIQEDEEEEDRRKDKT